MVIVWGWGGMWGGLTPVGVCGGGGGVDKIAMPARADRQAPGGAGYLGLRIVLWLMDRWLYGCVRASVGLLM